MPNEWLRDLIAQGAEVLEQTAVVVDSASKNLIAVIDGAAEVLDDMWERMRDDETGPVDNEPVDESQPSLEEMIQYICEKKSVNDLLLGDRAKKYRDWLRAYPEITENYYRFLLGE